MRYYDLTLTNSAGQVLALGPNGFAPSSTGLPTFSSRVPNPNGNGTIHNPGALNLELDMPVAPYAQPQGNQSVRLWGIGLRQLAQSAALNGNPATGALGAGFKLVAGMAPGLPLATAAAPYAGVIVQGSVYQAFGNWQGVNQTLELVIQPASVSPKGGIQFYWLPGQTLAAALQAALAPAFPGYSVSINISDSLVQSWSSESVNGSYQSLADLADVLQQQTQTMGSQVTGNDYYPGVSIAVQGSTIFVFDNTAPGKTVQLAFQDLIGQPTWLNANTVSFKSVLRADIQVGGQIQFPNGIASPYALTSAAAAVPGAPASSTSAFKGLFLVQEVHHFGNFRQADADSWATAYSAVAA